MAKDQKPAYANAVEPESDTGPGPFRRGMGHIPTWVIALLLLFPILVIDHFNVLREIKWFCYSPREAIAIQIAFYIALFIPWAVKRWNWRHVLVMLALAVAYSVISHILVWIILYTYGVTLDVLLSTQIVWSEYSLTLNVLISSAPLFLLGLGEMLLQRKRSWVSLAWLTAGVLAVTTAHILVMDNLWATGWWVRLPTRYGIGRQSLVNLIRLPLLTVLTWLTIPACLRIATSVSKVKRLALGGTFAGVVAVYVVFVNFLWYPLMETSMERDGPFEQAAAVWALSRRGKDSDFERIWQMLAEADWTEPCTWAKGNPSCIGDRRQMAIAALVRDDSAGTAERLSRLLRNRPRKNLAYEAAPLFAGHKRYETVPILMRYALSVYDDRCITALEQMNLPRAAFPIMRSELVWEVRFSGKQLTQFSKKTCKRLKRLLGNGPDRKVDAWLDLYDKVISERPTPLPEPIRLETDRVIQAMLRYYALADDWARESLVWGRQKGWDLEQTREMNKSIPRPDWNVRTTEELEREIEAYGQRVEAAIDKYFPAQTQPADTAPAN